MKPFEVIHTETGERFIALENILTEQDCYSFRLIKKRDLNPFTTKPEYPEEPERGRIFTHFKTGKEYLALGHAIFNDDYSEYVVYRPLNQLPGVKEVYARPKEMFYENVEIDGKFVRRFHPKE